MAHKYPVTIKTGDRPDAGTDANVYIQIIGDLGSTAEEKLDKPGYDDFEKGDEDTYEVSSDELIGIPEQVIISHDNKHSKSEWYLNWVKVKDIDTKKEVIFNYNDWINPENGLKKTLSSKDGPPEITFQIKDTKTIHIGKQCKILDWRDSEVTGYQQNVVFSVQSMASEGQSTEKVVENTLNTEVSVAGGTSEVQVSASIGTSMTEALTKRQEKNTSLTTTSSVTQTYTPQPGILLYLEEEWFRVDEVGTIKRNGREFPYTITISYSPSVVKAETYRKGVSMPQYVLDALASPKVPKIRQ
ncbi:PLAT/LH2 domain-containing protein [Microcoleus asticus]|uniref:PLAT domain-containing protein n=1 Tax=Microcoleus asticus IPMA8 TaxID=2563858 RepID=A0ABX2CYM5_9CYAN|nr:PLAT/LH2 domain-containing protein [Microcoleus asticus]NQE34738.1 hypothetical protein [Microcoleus asticus IPMA8]